MSVLELLGNLWKCKFLPRFPEDLQPDTEQYDPEDIIKPKLKNYYQSQVINFALCS